MMPPSVARAAWRVLALQALLTILLIAAALALALWQGQAAAWSAAKAVAFGALLGMLATAITARSVIKSSRAAAHTQLGQYTGMLPLYAGLLFKFVLIGGGVFVGLAHLGLGPFYVTLGYLVMQAGYARAA